MTLARLNELLDIQVMDGTGQNPPNYLANRQSLQAIIDKLQTTGWKFNGWDASGNPVLFAQVLNAVKVQLSRRFVVLITRDPQHQALVEARGEVAPGANSYERTVSQIRTAAVGVNYRDGESDAEAIILDTALKALGVVAVMAGRARTRPLNRVRDE